MTTRRKWLIGAIPLALFGLACCGIGFPIEVAFFFITGWGFFAYRVFPQVRVDWGSVVLALVCLTGFVAGLHVFLGWLYSAIPPQANETSSGGRAGKRWPLRWTTSITVLIALLFCAGIGATGVAHQVGWLWNSPERLLNADGARMAARRTQSVNNLKQIGLAAANYANDARNALPPGATFDRYGEALHGWRTLLLPYLEQDALYRRIDLSVPWDDPQNAPAFKTRVEVFQIPVRYPTESPAGYALAHYSGNAWRVVGGDRCCSR